MRWLALCLCLWMPAVAYAADCAPASAGDAQKLEDGVTTNGSGIVDSATAAFVVGDVGKTIWCVHAGAAVLTVTTIASRQSATRVTATVNATVNTTGAHCVWGTGDQTSAITTAVTACTGATTSIYPAGPYLGTSAGRVVLSRGGHIVSGRILLNAASGPTVSIVGSGRHQTILFLTPTLNPAPGSGAFLIQTQGAGMRLADFGIDAANFLYVGSNDLIRLSGTVKTVLENVEIRDIGINNKDAAILNMISTYSQATSVFIQDGPAGDKATACRVEASASTFRDVTCSNHYTNLIVANANGRTDSSSILTWFGGTVDECSHPSYSCSQLLAGAELDAYGLVFFGTTHGALSIASGAVAYLNNLNVGAFLSLNRGPGLVIASGGKAVVSQSTIRGNAGGWPVMNQGTFIDGGGNDYKNCTDGTCTSLTVGKAFHGKAPVRQ